MYLHTKGHFSFSNFILSLWSFNVVLFSKKYVFKWRLDLWFSLIMNHRCFFFLVHQLDASTTAQKRSKHSNKVQEKQEIIIKKAWLKQLLHVWISRPTTMYLSNPFFKDPVRVFSQLTHKPYLHISKSPSDSQAAWVGNMQPHFRKQVTNPENRQTKCSSQICPVKNVTS